VLTIGATKAMADAASGVYLPHHSWETLKPSTPRSVVTTVAYQGNPVFLGKWRAALEQACARRGWAFDVNPVDLGAADILVALRDGVVGWLDLPRVEERREVGQRHGRRPSGDHARLGRLARSAAGGHRPDVGSWWDLDAALDRLGHPVDTRLRGGAPGAGASVHSWRRLPSSIAQILTVRAMRGVIDWCRSTSIAGPTIEPLDLERSRRR
jgi:hypothetical protein